MYVAGADRAKVDFAVDVSRREHDKHAAAFAVATCRAKPRFAFVRITDDARAIVAQNGLDFRDRHALRAFWLDFRRPNRTSWSCVHKCVCKLNDGRKWSAGSLEIALLGRRVFREQRFAAIGGWPRTKMVSAKSLWLLERKAAGP
jgi:hypothetical protein